MCLLDVDICVAARAGLDRVAAERREAAIGKACEEWRPKQRKGAGGVQYPSRAS
jgi:hypothetical protein